MFQLQHFWFFGNYRNRFLHSLPNRKIEILFISVVFHNRKWINPSFNTLLCDCVFVQYYWKLNVVPLKSPIIWIICFVLEFCSLRYWNKWKNVEKNFWVSIMSTFYPKLCFHAKNEKSYENFDNIPITWDLIFYSELCQAYPSFHSKNCT